MTPFTQSSFPQTRKNLGGFPLSASAASMRLLILHHEHTDLSNPERYFFRKLTPFWEEQGIEVLHVAGVRSLPSADAVFLHVDLSVVPERFRLAALSFPLILNGKVTDIRKRSLPLRTHLLSSPGSYAGPVIVKTNLNNGGSPEYELYRRGGFKLPWRELWSFYRAGRLPGNGNYPVYESPQKVPARIWKNRDYVVEKFLPEIEDGAHVLRLAYFLGRTSLCIKLFSIFTTVRGENLSRPAEPLAEIPPEIRTFRESIGLDYGKVDYVLHEGKPVILDVNKTIGSGSFNLIGEQASRGLANGLPLIRT
jgi:hypothetical protein